jgi:cupin fold WbuC family metalloprotein
MQVATIDSGLIARILEKARAAPRRRTNHNFHASAEDNPHRFLNVLLEGTYIRPHRHRDPPKAETFLVLEGQVVLWVFDNDGNVVETHLLDGDGPVRGVDVPAGVYHALTAVSDHAVCFEVKPGPYRAETDKEFAAWAPAEGDAAAADYLNSLPRRR